MELLKKTALLLAVAFAAIAEDNADVADNSFLIEEAYNQEPGVVQFINSYQYNTKARSWTYLFVNEWPVCVQAHQFSYSVPVSMAGGRVGIGDVLINYRLQLMDNDSVSIAPRLSLIFPTGSSADALGTGGWGIQCNWAASITIVKQWVCHMNLGGTYTIAARNTAGQSGNTATVNFGGSIIYKPFSFFNILCEIVGTSGETIGAGGAIERTESLFINPGMRFAINVSSNLQIVPGISAPIGMGPSAYEYAVLGYLSIEGKLW